MRDDGAVRVRVLGTVEAAGPDGAPVPLGDRQRALLASLVARADAVVPVDRLVDLLWGERPPADPAGALHSQVSRLRRALPGLPVITRPPGYALHPAPGDVDARRFDDLVAAARRVPDGEALPLLGEALALWRGPAYAEFAGTEIARSEAIRLEEARLEAVEAWHRALLAAGRAAESLPGLESFVAAHPLREQARALLMRTLYELGRHADALASFRGYRQILADELGLEPSAAMAVLHRDILRQDVDSRDADSQQTDSQQADCRDVRRPDVSGGRPAAPLADLRARYVTDTGGHSLAVARIGRGPALVVLPGWVSSIDVIAAGRDPRSSLLQRLAGRVALTLYDRYGTGLSRGPVDDFGLAASVRELEAVVRYAGPPVNLLAMSQAGPVAVALAARHPELVDRLVFSGTYADAATVFTRTDLNASLVAMVRAHWGMGSRLFADLFRPDVSEAGARHLAEVLRDSADRETAASYLEALYAVDVTDLLPTVRAPALVVHYRGDRVVPFTGGRQLATGLPDARLITLDGAYHLPDAADLDRVVEAICDFLGAA